MKFTCIEDVSKPTKLRSRSVCSSQCWSARGDLVCLWQLPQHDDFTCRALIIVLDTKINFNRRLLEEKEGKVKNFQFTSTSKLNQSYWYYWKRPETNAKLFYLLEYKRNMHIKNYWWRFLIRKNGLKSNVKIWLNFFEVV